MDKLSCYMEMFSKGNDDKSKIMLEAITSEGLWIWHDFFGIAGSKKNINMLNTSNMTNDVLN